MKTLYPAIEPFDQGFFKVSELHELYYEQSGNPNGEPVIFLHGGPGGGSSPAYRQFFDPSFYRVIIFDQRGCGQSKPLGCLEDNNTDALI
ncbi:MAG: alpha/beta fold hydrolase, partial [Candidatus Sericytochromatia bacterium]|nr:alpha/beta fold hydrolase [Candidatus Sericytochromatia bacterium]